MNDTTVPDQQVTDEVPSRDEVFISLMHGLMANLPAPKEIAFRGDSVSIDLDSIAELNLWREWFGMQDREVRNQPHPSLSDPADMATWHSRVWMMWRGWHLGLNASDPITDEQRDGWVSSGQAASFAEYEAKQAAEAAGLDYSREDESADDPTPVSPARGGAPHVVAMTNDDLVNETPDPNTACAEHDDAHLGTTCPDIVAKLIVTEPVHYRFGMRNTACGLKPGNVSAASSDHFKVTCKTCIDKAPF